MRYNNKQSGSVHYVNLNDQNSNKRIAHKYIIVALTVVITLMLFSICLWRLLRRHHSPIQTTTGTTTKIKCGTCLNFTLTTILHEKNDFTTLSQSNNSTMLHTLPVSEHTPTLQTTIILPTETTFITIITTKTTTTSAITTMMNTMSILENYVNKVVYIQSSDLPDRYLSKNGSDWRIYLLPFSPDTTAFLVRPCVWQLLKETYPNLLCISLETASEEPRKYLQHGNHRVFVGSSDRKQSPNFKGDASFLLVGDTTSFRLRSTVAMQIHTAIWLKYYLPTYEVYMRWEYENPTFHRFRFVPQ